MRTITVMAKVLRNTMSAVLVSAFVILPLSCSSGRQVVDEAGGGSPRPVPMQDEERMVVSALPRAVIYKTTGDYYDNVPVGMDATGTRVVSYPAPSDLIVGGQLAKPVRLKDGYLLDRRGVTERTAFLDYTYEDYAALPAAPSPHELERHIVARHPFTEMYYVEHRGYGDIDYYNAFVDAGFDGCERASLQPALPKVKIKVGE